ncbi:PTS glucose transporter subunit IIA [Mycoplasmopsis ciconiae]|uniref:PTS glucose transporter subunit IIA n=1 Tax=Mycoplasmopsis ciconiae TaxID=561067 RepID=A0ABU7MKZ1_9BACT|nr:PTS glucose transporter subunit IIA [Mycoplasmopsis ciconiae]
MFKNIVNKIFTKNQQIDRSENLYMPCEGFVQDLSDFKKDLKYKNLTNFPGVNITFDQGKEFLYLYSPLEAKIKFIHECKHTLILQTSNNNNYMLHFGIDILRESTEVFQIFVNENQAVTNNDILLSLNLKKLVNKGYYVNLQILLLPDSNSKNLNIELKNQNLSAHTKVANIK